MDNVQILVTPEVLEAKSAEVEKRVKVVKEKFKNMHDIINMTSSYWSGEGGDKHREVYKSFEEDIDDILNRLSEHPRDLLTMAGIYRDTEQRNTSTVEALSNDVIQ